jgi:hypothetical protein
MNALRHKFLAGSTLAGDQDRAVKSRNFQGYGENMLNGLTAAHHASKGQTAADTPDLVF